MKRINVLWAYVKSILWVLAYGLVKVSIIDTSNGQIVLGEKRGKFLILDKNHWIASSMYPRPCEKPNTLVRGEPVKFGDKKYTIFDAGAFWKSLELVSYGEVRIFVQHEPYYGTHYHVVGRNWDGTYWVAPNFTDFKVKTPYEAVEGTVGSGLDVFRQGKAVNMDHPDWQQYFVGHTSPIRFIYTMF